MTLIICSNASHSFFFNSFCVDFAFFLFCIGHASEPMDLMRVAIDEFNLKDFKLSADFFKTGKLFLGKRNHNYHLLLMSLCKLLS